MTIEEARQRLPELRSDPDERVAALAELVTVLLADYDAVRRALEAAADVACA